MRALLVLLVLTVALAATAAPAHAITYSFCQKTLEGENAYYAPDNDIGEKVGHLFRQGYQPTYYWWSSPWSGNNSQTIHGYVTIRTWLGDRKYHVACWISDKYHDNVATSPVN